MTTTTEYQVTGMSCGHCETAIRSEVSEIPGVTGIEVSAQTGRLAVTAEHRVVENVETASGHERRGYARMLWEHANAEAEVLHAQEHHRTAEGDAFAQAMGGESADEATDYIDVCCICTGDDH